MAKTAERSAARLAAVQALYQMEVAGKGVIDALAEFEAFWIGREVEGVSFKPAENAFFRAILSGVVEEQRAIDGEVDKALSKGWPLKRVEAVLRAILRAGAYELMFRKDVPARVAITEYVEIAHRFYDEDEPGLVNGVLDALAREVRAGELEARKAAPSRARRAR
ncbi:MAG TPA: transcription antitermination factor NusB [Beijerinckiaceae bacterium]|jgi:transcription antitermination protein NusB|nr:transcription antitermination factor NusB [Beijerinckiaceae bacterium]